MGEEAEAAKLGCGDDAGGPVAEAELREGSLEEGRRVVGGR